MSHIQTGIMEQPNPYQNQFRSLERAAQRLRASGAGQRIKTIKRLEAALREAESDLARALHTDFGKPYEEVLLTEIAPVVLELRFAKRGLRRWMKPHHSGGPAVLLGTSSEVRYEPKGAALIIAPWNYPVTLTLGPLVSAVAAGCPVALKPSELTPATTEVLTRLLETVFEKDEVCVVPGGPEAVDHLLEFPFRHIYFTGSPPVGRKIMSSAARHLTSVTLELGGKSPAIIDSTCDLRASARSIIFGKFANAGQTCIAPDYLLVEHSIEQKLVSCLVDAVEEMYVATASGVAWSTKPTEMTASDTETRADATEKRADLSRVITRNHAGRLVEMIEEAVRTGAEIATGGASDVARRYVEPTILTNVPPEARLMTEEIFGPVLPICTFRTHDELRDTLDRQPPPLTAYVFSRSRTFIEGIVRRTEAGSIVVNETLLHFANPNLPFGGLSNSGMGRGHGFAGFKEFSNEKAVYRRRVRPRVMNRIHPPFSDSSRKWIRALIRMV